MNKIAAIFILFFASFQFSGAQNTEGHISYKIEFTANDSEMGDFMNMMQGSVMDLYYSDLFSRTDLKMGAMINSTTIMDLGSKKMLTLTSGMMGQFAVETTIPESEEAVDDDDFKVTLTTETKKIIGLNAKKAIVNTDEGESFEFWYTDDIQVDLKGQAMMSQNGIPGVLLEMVIKEDGFKMSFTALSYETKLSKKKELFSMAIPEGYVVKSAEEMITMPFGQ
jgi:GLPGLI family protein